MDSSPYLLFPTGRRRGTKEFEAEMVTMPNQFQNAEKKLCDLLVLHGSWVLASTDVIPFMTLASL